MRWKVEKKYIRIGVIAFVVVILSILFRYGLEHEARFAEFKGIISGTLWPIIVGSILAYILNPILHFFERYCFMPLSKLIFRKKNKEQKQQKFSRSFSIICTILLFMVLLIGGLYLVIPQVYTSLVKIVTDAPNYYNSVTAWVASLDPDKSEVSKYALMGLDRIYSQGIEYLNKDILPNMDKIVAGITSGIVGGLKMMLNLVLALIISVYVMAGKETLISVGKKFTYSMFSTHNANSILKGVRYADKVFGGFINGKIIDSFIIGIICYVFMNIVGYDYAVLISIIIGVTNVIPYFGPFIGGIPSVLILLMINPRHGLIFGIFVIILQQVDGNIIGPVILGDRLNLSSMWILFAILVGGGFFGVPGMILGAPCFACIYALLGTICKEKLKKKKLPTKTEDYLKVDRVVAYENGVLFESFEPEKKKGIFTKEIEDVKAETKDSDSNK